MAEVKHHYVEQNTAQTTTSGTYGDVTGGTIDGADLDASTKYLLIARALIGCNSTTDKAYFKITTADDATVTTHTESILEHGTSRLFPYMAVVSFSTDASPSDVKAQFKADVGATITVDQFSMLLLDLDDLGSGNYYEDKNSTTSSEYGLSAAATTLAKIDGSDTGITKTWLMLGSATTSVGSTSLNYGISLKAVQDAAVVDVVYHYHEGEDTAELRVHGVASYHKATTAGVDAEIQGWEADVAANMYCDAAYLIAIDTSAFANFEYDFAMTALAATTTPAVAQTVSSYTPTTNGAHLFISNCAMYDYYQPELYLADGSTATRAGDAQHVSGYWDSSTDWVGPSTMEVFDVTTTKTFNTYLSTRSLAATAYRGNLLVLNLNLAPSLDAAATVTATSETEQAVGVASPASFPYVRRSQSAENKTDTASQENKRSASTAVKGTQS